jgi:hypothetical protein
MAQRIRRLKNERLPDSKKPRRAVEVPGKIQKLAVGIPSAAFLQRGKVVTRAKTK